MCTEKERLLDLLKLANHELSSLLNQGIRLAKEMPDRAEELNQILHSAHGLHNQARRDLIAHILQHGCGTVEEIDRSIAAQD